MESNSFRLLPPNFSRDVRSILGLPFDATTQVQAEQTLRSAIIERRSCFMSTPNLNFAVACLNDFAFRESVLQSDLSLADGWPIVACARLAGTRLPERVAGSALFERLRVSAQRPQLAVYFFGGPDGAASAACGVLNRANEGTSCVGFEAPGFGSIEEMSTDALIDRINHSRPDILVLALGAKKGQEWIQHNLLRLQVPVISHLGAVVNFVAGTVRRAPDGMQSTGLEWLWRVKEEPKLWKRYAADGTILLSVLIPRVFAWATSRLRTLPSSAELASASVVYRTSSTGTELVLSGPWTQENVAGLRSEFAKQAMSRDHLTINMALVTHLDSCALGLLMLLYGWQLKIDRGWRIDDSSPALRRQFKLAFAGYLLKEVAK